MNISIDPDVFHAVGERPECIKVLGELERQGVKNCYILSDKLKAAYGEFLRLSTDRRYRTVRYETAFAIVRHLINGTRFKHLSPQSGEILPLKVKAVLENHELCELEKHLLSLGVAMSQARKSTDLGPSLVLLLTGLPELSPRCLHKPEFKDKVQGVIEGFVVHYSNMKEPISLHHIEPDQLTNSRQHVDMFEEKCTKWLCRRFECLPGEFKKIKGAEVDTHCYQTKGYPVRIVCVGECKLEFGENKIISKGDVEQLERKIAAVQQFELERPNMSTEPKLLGFIFSNVESEKIEDGAWRKAKELGINFVRVRMPTKWHQKPDWTLSDINFEELPYPETYN